MISEKNDFLRKWDISVFQHKAMNTLFKIFISGESKDYAEQAAQEAFNEIDLLEDTLSFYRPNSDISKINNLKPGEFLVVSEDTLNCLLKSIEMYDLTKGVFDISLGRIIQKWKSNDAIIPSSQESKMTSLVIDTHNKGVFLEDKIVIDLGGIGKGYSAEKICDLFKDWEIKNYMLSCGDSTVKIVNDEGLKIDWPLTFTNPINGNTFKEISVIEGSLNSSGKIKGDHIINPKTLAPVKNNRISVWVRTDESTIGDALSTSFMILGSGEIEGICNYDASISCMILSEDERIDFFGDFFAS